jgi:hypothetical protein
MAISVIEAEIRFAQHEVFLEAAKLVLTGEPIEIARKLDDGLGIDRLQRARPRNPDIEKMFARTSRRCSRGLV